MATLSVPRFYEQTVHGFLRYLDSPVENKESILRACSETHTPLVKTEIAELSVVRLQLEAMLGVAPKADVVMCSAIHVTGRRWPESKTPRA